MSPTQPRRFLIVGQGIAGSFLAWELSRRNCRITLIDNNHRTSSSAVAAGIINPITGKRFAVTPDFDIHFTYASSTYRALEARFSQTFFHAKDILRMYQDAEEKQHWERKVGDDIAQQYCRQMNPPGSVHDGIKDELGSVAITSSGFCASDRLLSSFKTHFTDEGVLKSGEFAYDDLAVDGKYICYDGEEYEAVIFCEGYRAQWNPWFSWLPFNSVKGEILKVAIDGRLLPPAIINKGKWCAPIGDNEWMAGSTYIWDTLDEAPTDEGREQILDGLRRSIKAPIRVLDHKAAVRPVIKDQNAVLGRHPEIPTLAIFNGLGSKGFLIAPLYACMLAEHLCAGRDIAGTLDVARFAEGHAEAPSKAQS